MASDVQKNTSLSKKTSPKKKPLKAQCKCFDRIANTATTLLSQIINPKYSTHRIRWKPDALAHTLPSQIDDRNSDDIITNEVDNTTGVVRNAIWITVVTKTREELYNRYYLTKTEIRIKRHDVI